MTTTKKCLKNATGTQKKRSLETDYQDDDEIIDIDEVKKTLFHCLSSHLLRR